MIGAITLVKDRNDAWTFRNTDCYDFRILDHTKFRKYDVV